MRVQKINNQSLLANAFSILLRDLGPKKAARIWQVITAHGSDYAKIRKQIFKGKTIDSIYKAAKVFDR